MDTLSHALWGRGLFGNKSHGGLAFFFGAFPDLPSFGLWMILSLFRGTLVSGAPAVDTLPPWVFFNYHFTHSFVIALPVIFFVSLKSKPLAFAMLGWPFHIVLDFPFHTLEYFPTEIFWPLSDFKVDGIHWAQPVVWFPNLAGLLILLSYRLVKKRRTAVYRASGTLEKFESGGSDAIDP